MLLRAALVGQEIGIHVELGVLVVLLSWGESLCFVLSQDSPAELLLNCWKDGSKHLLGAMRCSPPLSSRLSNRGVCQDLVRSSVKKKIYI